VIFCGKFFEFEIDIKMPYYKTKDNQKLFYAIHGKGPALVFIHGWCMNSSIWGEQSSFFSDDYRVLMPDLRGHGLSAGAGGPYTFMQFSKDIGELMGSLGKENIILVGWSMGSMVAMEYALSLSKGISGMVLISPTPCFKRSEGRQYGKRPSSIKRLRQNLTRNYEFTLKDFCERFFTVSGELIAPDSEREIRSFFFGKGFPPPQNVALETLDELERWDVRERAKKIDIPVLIIHGEADSIIDITAGKELHRIIPESNLIIIEGAGHVPFLTIIRKFNNEMGRFMEKVF